VQAITGLRCHGGTPRTGDPLEECEARADLERELSALPGEDLILLLFTFTPDTSFAEISRMSGVPVPTLKKRIQTIRRRLRSRLLN